MCGDIMFYEIIDELSKELGFKYTYLSKDWILMLEKGDKRRYIVGNKFDINGHAIGLTMDDKYAFYDLLHSLNLPVCQHNIFYPETNKFDYANGCNTKESMLECFNKYNQDVVIKPNEGSLGNGVYHITNKDDLIKYSDKLFVNNFSISMMPFYHIVNEYRVILLDNEVKLVFKKIKPVVVGDGKSSLKELLVRFNKYYFEEEEVPDMILKDGEVYEYDFHYNLSKGSIASLDIDEETKEKVVSLAKEVTEKANIRFASVDIILCEDGKMLVLEANSGVTINKVIHFIPNGYEIAKDVYKEAVIKMFNE
jgi:hypothetical protein